MQSPASHWDAYYTTGKDFGLIPHQQISNLLEFVDEGLGKKCLDVGCGTGQLTRELFHRGWQCVGIDVSSRAIKIAQSLTIYDEALMYHQFDIEYDDIEELPHHPYSLITCKLVYAFIQDKPRFLQKVSRLLAEGGIFIVITPVYENEDDKKPISVDFASTKKELQHNFELLAHYSGVGVEYFVCGKRV